jgi:hypothetical protein
MATEPAGSAIAASAAGGVAIGLSAASLIGVDLVTIAWAMAGGWFGTSFGPKLGPVKATVQFVLASLISALIATVLANYLSKSYGFDDTNAARLLAVIISSSFYILRKALLARIGAVADKFLTRIFGPDPERRE